MLYQIKLRKNLNNTSQKYRILFAGGGTGGHLFPAIAVANEIKLIQPDIKILFVGTKKKLESDIVPQAGYKFKPIWISGFSRKLSVKNIVIIIKLFVSIIQSFFICLKFKPQLAIGTGAYVSGPILWVASLLGSKIMLLEQNNYPGLTNRMLAKRAHEIHLSFESSKKYFRRKDNLFITGNPIRTSSRLNDKILSKEKFGLKQDAKTILILGGSLGARNINLAVVKNMDRILALGMQIIWQTGKYYFEEYKTYNSNNLKVLPFIDDMLSAYSAADLIVARAGATTIAEISSLGLPAIFIPSDNVTDDHQYKNAKALVDENAAELIRDKESVSMIYYKIVELINDEERLSMFSNNIKKFAKPNAARIIAERALNLIKERN
jgi:UDP-N-acetylglucosamine--N-acetylmuramyl-(pentapeptide) pyrophosphoryl-undecaprenol N-acetylglucosamine transferase